MSGDSRYNSPTYSGGVHHPAEADIESIRDLLHGYGSSPSILKELIQNAEDAGASRLDVIYLDGDPDSSHPLLRGPSLLVANDGAFSVEHRVAITQINLGTKAADERAIGRFGKGLKSVFTWCEAFFIVAETDPALGWGTPRIANLFNPWHGWRHLDWHEQFEADPWAAHTHVARALSTCYPTGSPWLAFLFPLRCELHAQDAIGVVGWIDPGGSESLPGEDPSFYEALCSEYCELAPSLVCLRSLQHISIVDASSAGRPSLSWVVPEASQRIPAPDAPSGTAHISGTTILRSSNPGVHEHRYLGLAGRLPDERIHHLKTARDWPKVVSRQLDRSEAAFPAKGEPHFATLITSSPKPVTDTTGTLRIRWSVFFPVGIQPLGPSSIPLTRIPHQVSITLHGYFFLDSDRLRIDGLEEGFKPNHQASGGTCLEWNRIVATEGTLARLPEALAAFALNESLSYDQCHELWEALEGASLLSTFRAAICRLNSWRPRWRPDGSTWECLPSESPVLLIPHTPDPNPDYS